jgi:copper chaperone CopZ
MKRILLAAVIAATSLMPALADSFTTEKIKVPTVRCGMCEEKIENGLKDLKGVKSIDVDLDTEIATVVFDESTTSLATIEQAIAEIGYDANETKANAKSQAKLSPCCRPGGTKH